MTFAWRIAEMSELWSTPFDELPTIGGTGNAPRPSLTVWWANLAIITCGLIGVVCIVVYVVTG